MHTALDDALSPDPIDRVGDDGVLRIRGLNAAQADNAFLERWEILAKKADVQYRMPYIRADAFRAEGEPLAILFESALGSVLRPVTVRPLGFGRGCDFTTPFEYGGPIVIDCSIRDKSVLVEQSQRAFETYCREREVVSEFVRFHPLLENHGDWAASFEIIPVGDNVCVDLIDLGADPSATYSRGQQRNLRNALATGISVRREAFTPGNVLRIIEFYDCNMDRLAGAASHRFPATYFRALAEMPDELISLYVSRDTIGNPMSFLIVIHGSRFGHTHLLGSNSHAEDRVPDVVLYREASLDLQRRGRSVLHLGGAGVGQGGVRQFKESLSKHRRPYFIGQKIHNMDRYMELVVAGQGSKPVKDPDYFPAYRG